MILSVESLGEVQESSIHPSSLIQSCDPLMVSENQLRPTRLKTLFWYLNNFLVTKIALAKRGSDWEFALAPQFSHSRVLMSDTERIYRKMQSFDCEPAPRDIPEQIVFSKTTHYRGYLGKIWRNLKFRDCHLNLGIYRNWLLISMNLGV